MSSAWWPGHARSVADRQLGHSGADKEFDARISSPSCGATGHPAVAQNTSRRRSAIDRRTIRHAGYAASQQVRKQIEETFGWIESSAGQARTRLPASAESVGHSPSYLPL
jgi:hypothetical protein